MTSLHIVHKPTQMRINFDELVIDNFAGGGGASTGIERAIGRPVDIAINHDPEALAMHAVNHPHTMHLCESVWDVDPLEVTRGRPVGLVHLSPDCKHFSRAKGGTPVEKKIRGLAWVALRWIAKTKPRIISLENVGEFTTWGPVVVGEDGMARPCPKRKGREFESFINAIKRHGYTVEYKELKASDYGAKTIRTRFFLIARRDGQPIVWPEITHGDPASEGVKSGKLKPWHTASECIDWSIPCPSIFERKRPLAEATCRRIAKGLMRYVVDCADPFIVRIGQNGGNGAYSNDINTPLTTVVSKNEHLLVQPLISRQFGKSVGSPVDSPIGSVTAGGMGKSALVSAFLAKHYGGRCTKPCSGMGDPVSTITQRDHNSLVTAHITKFRNGSVGSAIDEPVHTITAGGESKRPAGSPHAMGLVTSNMVKLRGTNVGHDIREPMHTISAGGLHHAEVRAFLIKYFGTDQKPRLDHPMHTVTTKDRFGLVTVHGEEYEIVDIGMRMLQPRELYRAQGFPDDYIIGDDAEQGLKLTKSAQVRMCGNSVCPDVMAALVSENFNKQANKMEAA